MTVDHPFLVRHADIVFALKTFAAAMLALVIALWLDLPRPYWAMATVYITSQPLAGATSSKAFYRVLGTVLGASVTVAIVPNLVNEMRRGLVDRLASMWVHRFGLFLSYLNNAAVRNVYCPSATKYPSRTEPGWHREPDHSIRIPTGILSPSMLDMGVR